jgi:hypothetical protein
MLAFHHCVTQRTRIPGESSANSKQRRETRFPEINPAVPERFVSLSRKTVQE